MFAAETRAVEAATVAPKVPEPTRTWKQIVEPVAPFLEQVAIRLTEQVETFEPEIAPYARYALTSQGKHLRPALVALSGGAVGKSNDGLVTVAVIIEMVHLATLVHDDVMDEAIVRRRRPTLAARWGNQISVLLGDCLFAHALKLAAGFPTPEVCRCVAAATKTVCSGEILQTHRRKDAGLSRACYFQVLEMKTAELFALSCELGSRLCGGNAADCGHLRNFGLALGTAYQIYDDCLDIFGSEATVGKSLGTDLAKGKVTLPILVALERGNPSDRLRLKELFESGQQRVLSEVLELLARYGALEESRLVTHKFLGDARRSLECLPESDDRLALASLTGFLAQQIDVLGV